MKFIKVLILSIIISNSLCLFAQVENKYLSENFKKKVLIFPFEESNYINDASELWSENSDMSHYELMSFLRKELNRRLQISMVDSCQPIDLLTSYTTEARNDLLGIYSSVNFRMEPIFKPEEEKEDKPLLNKLFRKKEDKDTIHKTGLHQGEIRSDRRYHEDKYLNIVFSNDDFIKDVCQTKDLDLIVFINQLDIRGLYGDPYISGNSNAKRRVKVHYSIYNDNGEQISGNHTNVDIPFRLQDPELFVEEYYPEIIRQITSKIDY